MTTKIIVRSITLALICVMISSRTAGSIQAGTNAIPSDCSAWLFNSLTKIRSIKVGSTRADLLKVFSPGGGVHTRTGQTFVFRECEYISVEVEFEPVGDEGEKLKGRPEDKIISISKPIVEVPAAD
jgi:hypothetical protein